MAALTTLALAGCGGEDQAGATDDLSKLDGRALLEKAMLQSTLDGKEVTAGRGSLTMSGLLVDPDEPTDSGEGELELKVALSPTAKGQELPEFSASFAVKGKSGQQQIDYAGGVSHVEGQLYAQWAGQDYAFGEALTAEAIKGLKDEYAKAAKDDPTLEATSSQLTQAMELEPGTWVKQVAVAEGGTVEDADTYRLSGEIDPRAASRDLVDGIRKLPEAFPGMADAEEFRDLEQISEQDLKELEQALTEADLVVWAGKDDGLARRMTIELAIDGDKIDEPGAKAELSFDLRSGHFNEDQNLKAPAETEPVTDLALKLEQEFGGLLQDFAGAQPRIS